MRAGGPALLAQAWTHLEVLRQHVGSSLPVTLYYVGEAEMPTACRSLFEETFDGLSCIDTTTVPDRPLQPPTRALGGFETKPFALFNAPYDELIFIDADSVPVRDPVALFDSPGYAEHGNLFWPDVCMLSSLVPHPGAFGDFGLRDGRARAYIQGVNPRIFDYLELPRPATLDRASCETESGQIVVDRRRCFDALQLAWFWSARPHHFRLFFYGDTEMYRLAFGVAGLPFHQVRQAGWHAGVVEHGTFRGRAMIQRDEAGEPFFVHQMHRKPSLGGAWRPLTHVTRDAAVDHPRPRAVKDVTMLAPQDALTHLAPLDGVLEKTEEAIHAAWDGLRARGDALPWPDAPARPWLRRKILPW